MEPFKILNYSNVLNVTVLVYHVLDQAIINVIVVILLQDSFYIILNHVFVNAQ